MLTNFWTRLTTWKKITAWKQAAITYHKRLSIRSRLLLASSLWLSAMLILAGVLIPQFVKDYLVDNSTGQLQLAMDQIKENLFVDEQGNLALQGGLSSPIFTHPQTTMYWWVSGKGYKLQSLSLQNKRVAFSKEFDEYEQPEVFFGSEKDKLLYLHQEVSLPDIKEPLTVIVGIDEDPLEYTLGIVVGIIWFIFFLLFIGFLVLLVVQIRWSLRPLGSLQEELRALETAEQECIEGTYPDELSPLVTDLNALLFHYQELLQRARTQAGNLSHSLKTPLSVLKNQITELPSNEREALSVSLLQIQEQIDYHLGRARMAGAANILSVRSCPSKRVDTIAMAFDKVYADREVVLVNEIETDLEVSIEQNDLDEILGNLIENSYKWSQSLIRVHAQWRENRVVEIIIEDNGPGISNDQLVNVTKRGVRLDESTPGSGLGLNIVSEIVHSYRGELLFERSSLGGLKAMVSLPVKS